MKQQAGLIAYLPQPEKEAQTRPLSAKLITRLFGFMRPYARKRNWLLFLVVSRSIQLPLLAWLIGAVIGGPVTRLDATGVLWGAAGYALLAIITQITMHYRQRLGLEIGEDVICDLRKKMFRQFQSMPMSFFNRTRLGSIISRYTSDSEAVRTGVQNVLFVSIVNVGHMIMAAALMIWYDWFLFLIVLAMAPVLWGLIRYFRKILSTATRAVQESFSRVTATLAESINGIRVTQGYVRGDMNAGLFNGLLKDHAKYNLDVARAAGVFVPLLEFNAQFFVALVLFVGGWRVLHGLTGIEDLYQFLLMANVFFAPIQTLGNQYNNALSAMAGGERVFKVLDATPEWTDPPDAIALPPIRGRVECRNVTFGYDPKNPVLHDITFTVEPGKTVALVGQTGSGKSSIINLISKFYLPTQGELLVDGYNLLNVRSDSLHRQMGIVLQTNFLFTGSVLDNIRFSKPEATREDVIQVAKTLDCLDLVASLPDGFNTVVGERGSGISLGQRQLICFARAMLADPRILILDEATSSVDAMTEIRIQKALEKLFENRTCFVVAHRLSTIRHADLVLVLEQGRIVERGTHEELLRQGKVYADLYRQFVRSADSGKEY